MTRVQFAVAGALVCVLTLSDHSLHGAASQYVESFNTATYNQATLTTANWDTGTGQLKLYVFAPALVGNQDTPGIALSVAVAGNLALVADDAAGLRIIDITDPKSPLPVGVYDTPGLALDVAVSGDLAFVADEAFGLQIINIANPASPVLVGTLDTPGAAAGVAVDGELAFVADAFSGLHIVDVSNPITPVILKTHNTPGIALRVAVSGNLVFVTDDTGGMAILDVTDPVAPSLVGTYDSPGNATDVDIAGDFAYLADGASGLLIVNISNPASPTLVGTYNTPGIANDVVVAGDLAYVADDNFGLHIVNVTNPAVPTLAQTVDTPGRAAGVMVDGAHAFIADDAGLQIVEVADPAYPRYAGFRGTPDLAYAVAVDGDFVFIACGAAGVQIMGVSNLSAPTLVGSYNTPGTALGVAVAGDLLFVADGSAGLHVINIANPASPSLLGTYNTPGNASDVAVSGNLAFVADGPSGLQVIRILNPASPTFVGMYDTPGVAGHVAVSGNLVLVSDALLNFGVRIINVSNPASPALLATYTAPGAPAGISIAGDLAYVAFDAGLQIFDISNPASPAPVGSIGSLVAQDVAVTGNLALVTLNGQLLMVDVSNPASPTMLAVYPTIGGAHGVATQGDIAYVADGLWGLHIIEVFNHEFYTRDNLGFSIKVNTTTNAIVAARLTSTQTPNVTWRITADAGGNWQTFVPDNTWTPIDYEGNDLRWLTGHSVSTPGVNPTVFDARIQWLYEFATIDAVADVPNDQGGWVRLNYTRSGRDLAAVPLPILNYGVWQRVDDAALIATLATVPRNAEAIDPSITKEFGALPLFTHAGRTFVESSTRHATGTLPPGTWQWIASIPALQQHNYLAPIATAADAPNQVVLVVTAHTTTPSIWYASAPDSGESQDNLAPPTPTAFAIAYNTGSGNTLSWDPSTAPDLQTFRVYRASDPDFTPSPGTRVHSTTATEWPDPDHDGGLVYYKITAVDFAGNESAPAVAGTVTSVGGTSVPERAALHQNHPNPFNPTTRIRYDVPRGGANVDLTVYDVSGRRVRALVSVRQGAGEKMIQWDGRDDNGTALATGVYFVRALIGDFTSTRKMILLK